MKEAYSLIVFLFQLAFNVLILDVLQLLLFVRDRLIHVLVRYDSVSGYLSCMLDRSICLVELGILADDSPLMRMRL